MAFQEYCFENGYGELFNSEIDDAWLKEQLLDAVKIKAKLDIFDKEIADSYWDIISQIYESPHNFDSKEYERLKEKMREEL